MDKLQKIQEHIKQALKKGDRATVSVLRLLQSEMKNKSIDKREALTGQEIDSIVRREIKRREEALVLYQQGQRQDLMDKEQQEITILKQYLPMEIPEADLKKRVTEILAEGKPAENFGDAMKRVMGKLKGQADGRLIKKVVEEAISKK